MLFVDAGNDRIGIGTSSPDNKFVVSDAGGAGLEFIPQTSNDRTTLLSYDRNANAYQTIDLDALDVHFNTSGTERMRIDTNGNVGVGVTPENSSGTWRNFEQSGMNLAGRSAGGVDGMIGTNYVFKTDNSEVYKYTAGTSRLFFDANVIKFQQAASGTAGTAISWSEAMRIDSNGDIYFFDNGGASLYYDASAGLTINEAGDDRDFRIESDNKSHMLFVDASADKVGINQSNPAAALDIVTTVTAGADAIRLRQPSSSETYQLQLGVSGQTNDGLVLRSTASTGLLQQWKGSEVVINDDSADRDFRVESNNNANMLFVDAGNDRVGIGTTPNAQLEVSKSADDSADLVRVQNTNTGASARSILKTQADTGHGQFGAVSSGWTADTRISANHAYAYGSEGFTLLTEPTKQLKTSVGSTNINLFTSGSNVFNESSADVDFRVESNSNANMLFLDAGNERLHVNGTTGTATFNVAGSSSFANTATSGALVASGATLSIQGTGTYNSNYFGTDRATVAIRSNEPSNDGWNPTINIATVRQSLGTNQNATGGIGFTTIDDSNNTGIDDAARIQVINTNGANNTSATGLVFYNNVGGSKTQASRAVFKLAPYEAIFNEDSHDIDFRVESNNNANMLFVDGGSDRVGIGRDPTDNDSTLQISADATSSTGLQLQCRGATNENKKLVLGYDTTSDIASITAFEAGVTHRPLHLQGSTFVWNEDGSDHDFRVESDSNAYGFFLDAGKKSVGVNFDASVSSYAQFGIRFSGSDTNVNSTGVAIQDSGTNSNVSFCTFFNSGGAGIGSITRVGTTNAVAFNTTSDRRAKENIADADDAGAVIDAIQVRKFDWIEGSQHQPYGMIAQELVEHAPEVVHQPADEEDMMGVDYSKLVPMLVKEIQSLRARVAQLESN